MDKAIDIAAALCRTFEGCRLQPYTCPAGIPTIGYGSTRYEDGRMVGLGDPSISKERAEALLLLTLQRDYLPGVIKASPLLVQYPTRLGALVDFVYNCGVPRYRASTLCRAVNAESWGYAKDQLMKWTRGGGRVLPGLVRRRAAEAALL